MARVLLSGSICGGREEKFAALPARQGVIIAGTSSNY
jgi:hypothetical protein